MTARSRTRVLHLLLWLVPQGGGIQTYLRAVCGALNSSAVELTVGALMPGQPTREVPRPAHLGGSSSSRAGNVIAFFRWFSRAAGDADVIHIHGTMNWNFVIGAAVCILRRVPFVVSPHGQVTHWMYQTNPLRRRAYLRCIAAPLLRRAAAVVATTEAERTEIEELAPGAEVRVVMPGIELREPQPPDPARASAELQAVYVGGFAAQKGLPVLFDAIALLRDQKVPIQLRLLGNGAPEFEQGLRRRVAELHLEDRVTFAGYQSGSDKERALAQADLFVLPSYMENFSFATAEALAQGTPVVVSTAVALAGAIQKYGCGVVVPVGDAAALAQAIAGYADPEVRRLQRPRARQCVQEQFSLQRMGRDLEVLYADVAANRAANGPVQ